MDDAHRPQARTLLLVACIVAVLVGIVVVLAVRIAGPARQDPRDEISADGYRAMGRAQSSCPAIRGDVDDALGDDGRIQADEADRIMRHMHDMVARQAAAVREWNAGHPDDLRQPTCRIPANGAERAEIQ